jgi:hypothetical protein
MMAACGDPGTLTIKRRITEAVRAGQPPSAMAGDRHGRASIRIALRQIKAEGQPPAALAAWLANFDQGHPEDAEDDPGPHQDG